MTTSRNADITEFRETSKKDQKVKRGSQSSLDGTTMWKQYEETNHMTLTQPVTRISGFKSQGVWLTVNVIRQFLHHRPGLARFDIKHHLRRKNMSVFCPPQNRTSLVACAGAHLFVLLVLMHVLNGVLEIFNVELKNKRIFNWTRDEWTQCLLQTDRRYVTKTADTD